MPRPSIFGKLRKWMAGSTYGGTGGGGTRDQAPATELQLAIPGQDQTNWCWAAVAQGISTFYGNGARSQCALVAQVLSIQPGSECCTNGTTSRCNKQWFLHKALDAVKCLRSVEQRPAGELLLAEIQSEIGAGQPVGIRIEWTHGSAAGSGHFVAISGWKRGASGVPYVKVEDPWGPATEILPIEEFANSYGTDAGTWTHSYFTLPPSLARQLGGSHDGIPLTADLMGG